DKYLLTTFAFGDGLSAVTHHPSSETVSQNVHRSILNYILVEITLGVPKYPDWLLSLRIHHRSGIYGLMDVDGGSDYLCLGITTWP
ncbi:MAG: hypothetical protein WCG27_11905, partial [Pseudomonadota bacterium]